MKVHSGTSDSVSIFESALTDLISFFCLFFCESRSLGWSVYVFGNYILFNFFPDFFLAFLLPRHNARNSDLWLLSFLLKFELHDRWIYHFWNRWIAFRRGRGPEDEYARWSSPLKCKRKKQHLKRYLRSWKGVSQ